MFTAAGMVNDSGNISIQAQDVAVASPIVGIVQEAQTLTSQDGTLVLRCKEASTDFTDLTAVPGAGPCSIIGGTGVYAGLHGQGTITSAANLFTRIETETITLNIA